MFNDLKELNAITVESMGYGANNISDNMLTADVMMDWNNLASAAMSKMETTYTLAATNKQLTLALANIKENEKLLSMAYQLTPKQQNSNLKNKAHQTVIAGPMAVIGLNHNSKT